MWNYIINLITVSLALLYLAKDWDAHKTSYRRATILILIILSGIGGSINNYYASKRNDAQHKSDREEITGLRVAVETANNSQKENTKVFVSAFGKLSERVSDLQSKVNTEELQKKADQLKLELAATQKALISPKATLTFSFSSDANVPVRREVTLPIKNDVVHVPFYVRNDSDISALDGELTIRICDSCKYSSEPQYFSKLSGQPETERFQPFDRILAKTHLIPFIADIQVPPEIDKLEFAVWYRCRTCIVPTVKETIGTISISR